MGVEEGLVDTVTVIGPEALTELNVTVVENCPMEFVDVATFETEVIPPERETAEEEIVAPD